MPPVTRGRTGSFREALRRPHRPHAVLTQRPSWLRCVLVPDQSFRDEVQSATRRRAASRRAHHDAVKHGLHTGTVTLLFTDIEGSTFILRDLGDQYAEVLSEHRRILRSTFAAHDGVEVDTQGDSFFVAFPRASDAVAAAVESQRRLATSRSGIAWSASKRARRLGSSARARGSGRAERRSTACRRERSSRSLGTTTFWACCNSSGLSRWTSS